MQEVGFENGERTVQIDEDSKMSLLSVSEVGVNNIPMLLLREARKDLFQQLHFELSKGRSFLLRHFLAKKIPNLKEVLSMQNYSRGGVKYSRDTIWEFIFVEGAHPAQVCK